MYQAIADALQASQSDDESSKRSQFTLILPASPGMGLNDLRGDSNGTSLATGRPYRIIVNATKFFSTSETRLEKCVFASFTFIVNGIWSLLSLSWQQSIKSWFVGQLCGLSSATVRTDDFRGERRRPPPPPLSPPRRRQPSREKARRGLFPRPVPWSAKPRG